MKHVIGILIISSMSLSAEMITLEELVQKVVKHHPFFTSESIAIAVEETSQEQLLGDQDWVITSSPYYMHQEPVASGIGVPERIDFVEGNVGIEKVFWNTGGRASLEWTSSYTDQTVNDIVIPLFQDTIIMSAGPSEFYSNKIYLTYTQPILKNFGGSLDRLEFDLQEYTIDAAKLQTQENKEVFILDIVDKFLEWVSIKEQMHIVEDRLALAVEQLAQIKRKYAANLVDRVDVLRAEEAVRIAEQSKVLLGSQYRAKGAELAVLSRMSELTDNDPEFDLYNIVILPSVEDALQQMRQQSVVLNTLRLRIEQMKKLKDGYDETKRPQLNFTIGAGLQGGDDEFGSSFDLDKPDALVALDFRYPLGTHRAHSQILKTELEIQKLEAQIEELALGYEAAIKNLLILIKDMEEVLQLNKEQIESAHIKTNEELRLYNQGRNYLSIVIQSRDDEQQAKYRYTENAALYQNLVMQYYALMDELFVRLGGDQ